MDFVKAITERVQNLLSALPSASLCGAEREYLMRAMMGLALFTKDLVLQDLRSSPMEVEQLKARLAEMTDDRDRCQAYVWEHQEVAARNYAEDQAKIEKLKRVIEHLAEELYETRGKLKRMSPPSTQTKNVSLENQNGDMIDVLLNPDEQYWNG